MEEITGFGERTYSDFRMVHLRLPLLRIESPYPGDYRSAVEVQAATETFTEVKDTTGEATSWKHVRVVARR
jgi:hypothetical protein